MFRFETLKSLISYPKEAPPKVGIHSWYLHSLTGLQWSALSQKKHSGNSLVPRVVLAAQFFHFGGKSVEAPALLLLLLLTPGALHTALHTTPGTYCQPRHGQSGKESASSKYYSRVGSQAKEPTNQRNLESAQNIYITT